MIKFLSIALIIFLVITGNANAQVPELQESCKDCPENNFKKENFLEHAQTKFEEKFPFDAIEVKSGGSGGECMIIAGKQECSVKNGTQTMLGLVKYPIWVIFLISLIKLM